jgi:hypothetical protein
MEHKYNNLTVNQLNLILEKLSETKSSTNRIFKVGKILSVNTRHCKYVGGENTEIKTHLQVKFTSPDERGPICMSVLLDNYSNLI